MRLKSIPAKPMPSLQAKASVNYEILGLKDMCKISLDYVIKMITNFMLLLWMNNKP